MLSSNHIFYRCGPVTASRRSCIKFRANWKAKHQFTSACLSTAWLSFSSSQKPYISPFKTQLLFRGFNKLTRYGEEVESIHISLASSLNIRQKSRHMSDFPILNISSFHVFAFHPNIKVLEQHKTLVFHLRHFQLLDCDVQQIFDLGYAVCKLMHIA